MTLNYLSWTYFLHWGRGIVVMDFNCYTGDRGSIPTHCDSFGKGVNLRLVQPMHFKVNWVVSQRCWRDIDTRSVYNCENGLLSPLQFNHIEIEIEKNPLKMTNFFWCNHRHKRLALKFTNHNIEEWQTISVSFFKLKISQFKVSVHVTSQFGPKLNLGPLKGSQNPNMGKNVKNTY